MSENLEQLKADFDKDAIAYLKSFERANTRDLTEYLEKFEVPGYVKGTGDKSYCTVYTNVQKYRQFLTPIETYLATKSHLQDLINAQVKARRLENFDPVFESKKSAVRKYLTEYCVRQLLGFNTIEAADKYADYIMAQLDYFKFNKAAQAVPFNAETLAVAENLAKNPIKGLKNELPLTTLKWLQQFSFKELKELYQFCNGPEYLIVTKNGSPEIAVVKTEIETPIDDDSKIDENSDNVLTITGKSPAPNNGQIIKKTVTIKV